MNLQILFLLIFAIPIVGILSSFYFLLNWKIYFWLIISYLLFTWNLSRIKPRLNLFKPLGLRRILPTTLHGSIFEERAIYLCYPHGVLSLGPVINFILDKPPFAKNSTFLMLTISLNFWIPLWRDLLIILGFNSVSRSSIKELLQDSAGSSLIMLLGGAKEAGANWSPQQPRIVIRGRIGIFRLAKEYRIPVIPVFTFGELEVFPSPIRMKNHWLFDLIRRVSGMMPLLVWPPLPRQVPLNSFIGQAIHPDDFPSTLEFQSAFIKALVSLYYQHNESFNYGKLELVD